MTTLATPASPQAVALAGPLPVFSIPVEAASTTFAVRSTTSVTTIGPLISVVPGTSYTVVFSSWGFGGLFVCCHGLGAFRFGIYLGYLVGFLWKVLVYGGLLRERSCYLYSLWGIGNDYMVSWNVGPETCNYSFLYAGIGIKVSYDIATIGGRSGLAGATTIASGFVSVTIYGE